MAQSLAERKPTPPEDLTASGKISTTIEDVDGNADDWYEKQLKKLTLYLEIHMLNLIVVS